MNPERLRRALARRNEATHPLELPGPEPGRAWREGDPCELCGEPEYPDDVIAHFKLPAAYVGEYVMAHASCGEARELELA